MCYLDDCDIDALCFFVPMLLVLGALIVVGILKLVGWL